LLLATAFGATAQRVSLTFDDGLDPAREPRAAQWTDSMLAALDAAGIVVNKNTIPYDTESPFKTSGIRVGTASVTTRGMKEAEMIKIGTWIADVLDNIADTSIQERVKREAAELVANFPVP
jgi:glycine/serine hydroxymethyltransferase